MAQARLSSAMQCRNRIVFNGALALALLFTLLGSPAQAEFAVASGAVAVPGSAANTSAPSVPVWRYTVRPGDSLPQIAENLLKPGKGWPDLVHFNHLHSSAAAVPGSTLEIPMHWLREQPQPARVTAVSGSVVRVSQRDNQARPLKNNDTLYVGDRVQTLNGRAVITLADGSTLRLEPQSLLVFDRMTQFGKSGMADTRLRLERGRVGTQIQPLAQEGSSFRIETPSAVAAVRGTAFRLSTDAVRTRLEVTQGQVSFSNGTTELLVNAGSGAELGSGSSVRQYPLPPAPELASIPANVEELPLSVEWDPVTQAATYQLDLFDRGNNSWLASRHTNKPQQLLANLDNGNYRLEVTAVSGQGLTGLPATADFSIGLQAQPALLQTPADGAEIADDEPLQFGWTFQGESETAQVEISRQSNFSNVIATSGWSENNTGALGRALAPGPYYWRVVTEAGGSSVAMSETRSLVIGGSLESPDIININYFGNEVRIFWRNVPMSDGYLLQLARDPGFDSIIREAEIDSNTAALRLANGQRYFVRLRGLTEGPLESSWSAGRELYVE